MKTKNALFFFLVLVAVTFQSIVSSERDIIQQTKINERFSFMHPIQEENDSDNSDMSSMNSIESINKSVDKKISLNSKKENRPILEQILSSKDNPEKNVADMFEKHELNLRDICIPHESNEDIKKCNKRKMQTTLLSAGIGAIIMGTSLNAKRISNAFLQKAEPEKRLFVIDDLMAASAAQSIAQVAIPTILAGILGYTVWRQVDFYLHAEERSHFVVLESRFTTAFTDIKRDVAKQFEKNNAERKAQYLEIHQFIDKSISTIEKKLEAEIKHLRDIEDQQEQLMKSIIEKNHEDKVAVNERIHANSENMRKAIHEIAGLQETITALKENTAKLTTNVKSMMPLVSNINNIVQRDPYADLANVYIPTNSSPEHKDDTQPVRPKPVRTMSTVSTSKPTIQLNQTSKKAENLTNNSSKATVNDNNWYNYFAPIKIQKK